MDDPIEVGIAVAKQFEAGALRNDRPILVEDVNCISVFEVLEHHQVVGELSSAGWSPKAGACVALGYVRGPAATAVHEGTPVRIDLWGEGVGARAFDRWSG